MEWIVLLLIVLHVALDAYSDAKLDDTGKRNHYTESLAIAALLGIALVNGNIDVWRVVSSYVLIRIGVFNFVYNTTRKLPFNYIGKTDQIFDKWVSKLPSMIVVTIQVTSVFAALVLILYRG